MGFKGLPDGFRVARPVNVDNYGPVRPKFNRPGASLLCRSDRTGNVSLGKSGGGTAHLSPEFDGGGEDDTGW